MTTALDRIEDRDAKPLKRVENKFSDAARTTGRCENDWTELT
jgi:hypothetical protein